MNRLFLAILTVMFCSLISFTGESKIIDNINMISFKEKKNNVGNKCSFEAVVLHKRSFNSCIKKGYSHGRLKLSDCSLWALMDSNDFYYKCIMNNSGDKFH